MTARVRADPKPPTAPMYLGDGLYVEFDGYQFEVYASNGLAKTNRVFMEPSVVTSFFEYVARTRAGRELVGHEGPEPVYDETKFIDAYDETEKDPLS